MKYSSRAVFVAKKVFSSTHIEQRTDSVKISLASRVSRCIYRLVLFEHKHNNVFALNEIDKFQKVHSQCIRIWKYGNSPQKWASVECAHIYTFRNWVKNENAAKSHEQDMKSVRTRMSRIICESKPMLFARIGHVFKINFIAFQNIFYTFTGQVPTSFMHLASSEPNICQFQMENARPFLLSWSYQRSNTIIGFSVLCIPKRKFLSLLPLMRLFP